MKKGNEKQEAVRILRKVALKSDHLELGELKIVDGCIGEETDHNSRHCDVDGCDEGDCLYVSITKKGKEFLRKNDIKGKNLLIKLLEKIMISLVKSEVTIWLTTEEQDFLSNYGIDLVFTNEKKTILVDGDFKRYIARLIHLLFNGNEYCEVE